MRFIALLSCLLVLPGFADAQHSSAAPTAFSTEHAPPEPSSTTQSLLLVRPADVPRETRILSLDVAALERSRSPWTYPLLGALVGAAAGTAYGVYVMATAEEYLAPPAPLFTAPLGAVVGALLGLVANAVHPPRSGAADASERMLQPRLLEGPRAVTETSHDMSSRTH